MSRSPFVVAALVLAACQSQGKPPETPAAPPAQQPAQRPPSQDVTAQDFAGWKLPHARVTLVDAKGGKHVVDAEVASTRDQRTRGLMWRTVLPEGTGMLFIFEQEDTLSFWMKNTLIPLDMIFIDGAGTIVGIVRNAEPKTLSPRGPGEAYAQYVLEVPGGWTEKVHLKSGSAVTFDGISSIVPSP